MSYPVLKGPLKFGGKKQTNKKKEHIFIQPVIYHRRSGWDCVLKTVRLPAVFLEEAIPEFQSSEEGVKSHSRGIKQPKQRLRAKINK